MNLFNRSFLILKQGINNFSLLIDEKINVEDGKEEGNERLDVNEEILKDF